MLTPPIGRDPLLIDNDISQRETVEQAVRAMQTRSSGAGSTGLVIAAPQGAGLTDGDGNSLVGVFGFALGFSGLGGDDYLFPPSRENEVPPRAFWELY